MAASTAQNPSKSSKKKAAAKAPVERTDSPAPSTASGAVDKNADSQDGFESPYLKEVQKNIRNVSKKLTNASKTDGLIAQHPGKSLDDLIAAKIINADQKAQIVKKPALQAQLAQLEEQQTQHRQVHEQYQTKAAADKADSDKALEKAKADAVAEAHVGFKQQMHDNLLLLSQFLRLAAYRREEAKEPESDESQAIEGVLLAIYSGDEGAVSSMLKLVEGSEDSILSVPGDQLQTSYAHVNSLSKDYKTPFYSEGAQPESETPDVPATTEIGTDPTVANASATEIEAGDAVAPTAGPIDTVTNGISNASVSDDAANAVAESHWDNSNDMSISQEWVDVTVPRDPAETDTGLAATPAAPANTQSWADEQPDPVPEPAPAPADPNEGFHQVNHRQRRPEREGSFRGRGGRGEFRGRGGYRGDGRGRGRGRGNGNGPARGPRRAEE